MPSRRSASSALGNEPPLLADGRRAPDRREISLRWLSGTFLTGITSCALMGVALFAAVDGREQLALPGEAMAAGTVAGQNPHARGHSVAKGGRLVSALTPARATDRSVMEVSTLFREDDRDVVRRQPFAHVKVQLAANHAPNEVYPSFDPLAIFSTGETQQASSGETGVIYGASVESEISLRTTDFPLQGPAGRRYAPSITAEEAEETVRNNGSILTDGSVQVAALHYVDPQRFASLGPDLDFSSGLNARVITENVSLSIQEPLGTDTVEFAEDIIAVGEAGEITDIMAEAGYGETDASLIAGVFSNFNGSTRLRDGDMLRLGIEQYRGYMRIVRASIYAGGEHAITVAENDRGFFVRANPPANADIVREALGETLPAVVRGRELPSAYDGIYQAALSYGLNQEMTAQIIRLLASDVDFQSRLRPSDTLEAFFSVDAETKRAGDESELLFVRAVFGESESRFYRFRSTADGSIDYFDEEGRSARQFLIRNPLPNGRFTSGYGMRRHPILGYSRMHAGVDWAAPTGTPIIAAGNGVVESAGWHSGGFGRHTVIRHSNGYVSSYSHQSRIANGVVPGARVTQGQVIGYVGSTGMSTGPHLHYELSVNGSKVDPMRVRLPDAKALEGEDLAAFQKERRRIDALLGNEDPTTELAQR